MSLMNIRHGDIALVYFPWSDIKTVKKRPALVVQADNLKPGTTLFIVAQITTNPKRAGHPSRVSVDPDDPRFAGTGLRQVCIIATDVLMTIDTSLIEKTIGTVTDMRPVDTALRTTLAL